jgi:hypothetical protein
MPRDVDRRSPTPEELSRAVFIDEVEPLLLVGPTAAAKFLTIKRHTLACYRHAGGGPPYFKFGRWIRYSVDDLREWAGQQKRSGVGPKTKLVKKRAKRARVIPGGYVEHLLLK